MPRSKQNKQNKGAGKDKDGRHRKETKEERKLRLKQQEEAREACLKLLPVAGGVMLVLVIAFGLWVRSVPPKEINPLSAADSLLADSLLKQPQFQGDVPDFVNVNSEPLVKEALNEAQEILKNRDLEMEANNNNEDGGSGGDDKENIETIEL